MRKHPKKTNAVMTGSLFGAGDIIAQIFFPSKEGDGKYDYMRTTRSVVYGSMVFSFIGDKWFRFVNNKLVLPRTAPSHWTNTIYRVTVDQLLFAPALIPLYFGSLTLMEGKSLSVAKHKIDERWWETLRNSWFVWPPFQLLNFSLVPVQHRLLAANCLAIFWNTYLSYKNSVALSEDDKVKVNYPPIVE